MKYCFLAAALLGAIPFAQAQIGAGTVLLSGGIGYSQDSQREQIIPSSNKQELTYRISRLSLSPLAGYFVTENLMLGLRLGYQHDREIKPRYALSVGSGGSFPGYGAPTSYSRAHEDTHTVSVVNVGPALRYYRFLGERAAFFGELGANYLRTNGESSVMYGPQGYSDSFVSKGNGVGAELAPGFVFFPTPSIGLELSLRGLSYRHFNSEITYDGASQPRKSSGSTFDAGLGFEDLRLGFSFYIGRK